MGHRPDWNNTNFKKGAPKVRGFADGGEVDAREAARDDYFAPKAEEPAVDTYEFGRYDEMQENKDRYARDQENAARVVEDSKSAQEAARELSTIANVKSEARPAPKPVAKVAKVTVTGKKSDAYDYGDETSRMLARNPAPKAPEPRKFMGREVVETPEQRKASDAYRQANPFLPPLVMMPCG